MRIYSGHSVLFHWNICLYLCQYRSDVPGGSDGKASAYNVGDPGLIPGLGRSSGEGYGNPLQYSGLENPMDGGACEDTVHGVAKSRTRLSDFTHTHTHMPVAHDFNSFIFVVSFEIRKCEFSTFVFLFQDCFEYFELPESPYGF